MQDTERKINRHKSLIDAYNRKNNTNIKYQINEHNNNNFFNISTKTINLSIVNYSNSFKIIDNYISDEHIDLYQVNDEESDFIFGHELGHADFFENYPYNKYLIYSTLLVPLCFLNKKTIIVAPLIFGINILNNYVREFYADLFSVQFFKHKNTSYLNKMDNQISFGLNCLKQNNKLAYLNGEFICLTDKFIHPSLEYRKYAINNFDLNQNITIFNIFKSIFNI